MLINEFKVKYQTESIYFRMLEKSQYAKCKTTEMNQNYL